MNDILGLITISVAAITTTVLYEDWKEEACKEKIKFEDIRDLMTFKDVAKITEAAANFLQFLD